MKVEWDKEYKVSRGKGIYKEEFDEICRFLKSNHKNVCFTYELDVLARNAYNSLHKYAEQDNLPVKFKRRRNELYVFKEDAK